MGVLESGLNVDITLWFHTQISETFSGFLQLFSVIGSDLFFILLFSLLFWTIDKSLGKRVILLYLITTFIGLLLGNLILLERPYIADSRFITLGITGESFSFPSLMVLGVSSFWFYLLTRTKNYSVKLICIIIPLFTAISRMVHGVNYLLDVVIAMLLAAIVVLLFVKFEPAVSRSYNEQYNLGQKLLLVTFVSSVSLLLVILSPGGVILEAVAIIGAFTGLFIGIVLEKEFINFSVDGTLMVRALRYILGLLLLSLVYFIVSSLFILLGDNYPLVFIEYTTITLLIAFGIPYVLHRVK